MDSFKAQVEKECRKHRASGGKAESPMDGDDDATKDLKDTAPDRSAPNNIAKEAKQRQAKKGGRIKRKDGGCAEGKEGMKHMGRKHRASGGGCEGNPFTAAHKGTEPEGRKVMNLPTDGEN